MSLAPIAFDTQLRIYSSMTSLQHLLLPPVRTSQPDGTRYGCNVFEQNSCYWAFDILSDGLAITRDEKMQGSQSWNLSLYTTSLSDTAIRLAPKRPIRSYSAGTCDTEWRVSPVSKPSAAIRIPGVTGIVLIALLMMRLVQSRRVIRFAGLVVLRKC